MNYQSSKCPHHLVGSLQAYFLCQAEVGTTELAIQKKFRFFTDKLGARRFRNLHQSYKSSCPIFMQNTYLSKNKAGYTATEVACGWAGAVFEGSPYYLGRSSEVKEIKS